MATSRAFKEKSGFELHLQLLETDGKAYEKEIEDLKAQLCAAKEKERYALDRLKDMNNQLKEVEEEIKGFKKLKDENSKEWGKAFSAYKEEIKLQAKAKEEEEKIEKIKAEVQSALEAAGGGPDEP